jgi:hypothetical protein
MEDGIVAAKHGEARVMMKHFEPQLIAVEVHGCRRISDGKRRDRLPETCHVLVTCKSTLRQNALS